MLVQTSQPLMESGSPYPAGRSVTLTSLVLSQGSWLRVEGQSREGRVVDPSEVNFTKEQLLAVGCVAVASTAHKEDDDSDERARVVPVRAVKLAGQLTLADIEADGLFVEVVVTGFGDE